MTAVSGPEPAAVPSAALPDARAASEAALILGAERWIREAVDAWTEDDHGKVALTAPIAVELLGKATLWRENPVLLVPLSDKHEASLFLLATRPDLASKDVRTIGLLLVMNRLIKLLGDLPVTKERRQRIVDMRNGAVHAGAAEESRYVLLDCLTIIGVLLQRLGLERKAFFGSRVWTVEALLEQRKTEVSRQVADKMAKARARLSRLEDTLGEAAFLKATDELELERWALDPDDYVQGGEGVEIVCPECASKARLFGGLDVTETVNFVVSVLDDGTYSGVPTGSVYEVGLRPSTFFCTVCKLELHGGEELAEAGLPAQLFDVTGKDLGPDFDLDEKISRHYWAD